MKKIELTYADIELLQYVLSNVHSDYFNNSSIQTEITDDGALLVKKKYYDIWKINELSVKLIAMRAQLEYPKLKGE